MIATKPQAAVGWHLAHETTGRPAVWAVDPDYLDRLAVEMAAGTGAAYITQPAQRVIHNPDSTITGRLIVLSPLSSLREEMPMQILVIDRLAGLRLGDRITCYDGRRYRSPLRVTDPLVPIGPGSPVRGENPNPSSAVEWVLYPSQMDGRPMGVERYQP